jgi:hypothetical protein
MWRRGGAPLRWLHGTAATTTAAAKLPGPDEVLI